MNKREFLMGLAVGKAQGGGGGGGDISVASLTATENKIYTAPAGEAYSPVTVNVPNSYSAADEGKVVSNGALAAQTAHAKVTQNGTIDTTLNNSVEIDVPTGGGGATVEALSVTQNGTYTAPAGKAYSPVTVNVQGGGPSPSASQKAVNFIDYAGTILYSYTAEEAQALTALPANPSHTGLTAQGWNWTLAQIKAQLTNVGGDVWVGQMYVTDDGKTRLYCHFEEGRLAPYLGCAPNGTVVVDWGDGSSTDTLTGTSTSATKTVQHTYASAGDYVITLELTSGTGYALMGSSSIGSRVLNKTASGTGNESRCYQNAIQKVEPGVNASIGSSAFSNCYSLTSITIPSGVTSIGAHAFQNSYSLTSITIPSGVTSIGNAFQNCSSLTSITIPSGVTSIGAYAFQNSYSLTSITIPSGVTSIGSSAFSNCSSLTSITIPDGVTSIDGNAFSNCYSLTSITIPSGVTSIGSSAFSNCSSLTSITIPSGVTSIGNAFQNCSSLTSITIPSGVTSIGDYAFQNCYGLGGIHFKPATPPTVKNSNAFGSLATDCIIYVPTGSLEAYTSATNYPSSSTYTYVEE